MSSMSGRSLFPVTPLSAYSVPSGAVKNRAGSPSASLVQPMVPWSTFRVQVWPKSAAVTGAGLEVGVTLKVGPLAGYCWERMCMHPRTPLTMTIPPTPRAIRVRAGLLIMISPC